MIEKADAPVCRFCRTPLQETFVDLGTSPLCQRHVTPSRYNHAEAFYPLHSYVCTNCYLVQLPQYVDREEIFDDEYGYFSSFSETWLKHAEDYTNKMISRFGYSSEHRVVEVASNDGYLLQYFAQRGVKCLGIEPTANTAAAARTKGIETIERFFGVDAANDIRRSHGQADLLLGNNVLAHVPDINDFVEGLKILLSDGGVITVEFPVLSSLIENNYFDTIYHEHFSYLSFTTVEQIFAHHGLTVFDVEKLPTHGGSIRVYARHSEHTARLVDDSVAALRNEERVGGHGSIEYYRAFGERVRESKRMIVTFLIKAKRAGKTIAAYGAPGKGNTLLNYCGVRTDFIDFTVDRSPHKQGNYLPGSRIPILHPDEIIKRRPDYLFVLVWNLKNEVMQQMSYIADWGGQFVIPLPELHVIGHHNSAVQEREIA